MNGASYALELLGRGQCEEDNTRVKRFVFNNPTSTPYDVVMVNTHEQSTADDNNVVIIIPRDIREYRSEELDQLKHTEDSKTDVDLVTMENSYLNTVFYSKLHDSLVFRDSDGIITPFNFCVDVCYQQSTETPKVNTHWSKEYPSPARIPFPIKSKVDYLNNYYRQDKTTEAAESGNQHESTNTVQTFAEPRIHPTTSETSGQSSADILDVATSGRTNSTLRELPTIQAAFFGNTTGTDKATDSISSRSDHPSADHIDLTKSERDNATLREPPTSPVAVPGNMTGPDKPTLTISSQYDQPSTDHIDLTKSERDHASLREPPTSPVVVPGNMTEPDKTAPTISSRSGQSSADILDVATLGRINTTLRELQAIQAAFFGKTTGTNKATASISSRSDQPSTDHIDLTKSEKDHTTLRDPPTIPVAVPRNMTEPDTTAALIYIGSNQSSNINTSSSDEIYVLLSTSAKENSTENSETISQPPKHPVVYSAGTNETVNPLKHKKKSKTSEHSLSYPSKSTDISKLNSSEPAMSSQPFETHTTTKSDDSRMLQSSTPSNFTSPTDETTKQASLVLRVHSTEPKSNESIDAIVPVQLHPSLTHSLETDANFSVIINLLEPRFIAPSHETTSFALKDSTPNITNTEAETMFSFFGPESTTYKYEDTLRDNYLKSNENATDANAILTSNYSESNTTATGGDTITTQASFESILITAHDESVLHSKSTDQDKTTVDTKSTSPHIVFVQNAALSDGTTSYQIVSDSAASGKYTYEFPSYLIAPTNTKASTELSTTTTDEAISLFQTQSEPKIAPSYRETNLPAKSSKLNATAVSDAQGTTGTSRTFPEPDTTTTIGFGSIATTDNITRLDSEGDGSTSENILAVLPVTSKYSESGAFTTMADNTITESTTNEKNHLVPPSASEYSLPSVDGVPSRGLSSQGMPSKGVVPEGVVSQSVSTEGMPSKLVPIEIMSSKGMLPEGVVSQSLSTEGMPSKLVPIEMMSSKGMSSIAVHSKGTPSEGVPSQVIPSKGMPSITVPSGVPFEGVPAEVMSLKGISFIPVTTGVPSKGTPSESMPTEVMPSKGTPSEGVPTRDMISKVVPSDSMPTEVMPSKGTPSEGVPIRVMISKGVPSGVPSEGVPTRDMTSKDVPLEGMQTEVMPSKGTPSETANSSGPRLTLNDNTLSREIIMNSDVIQDDHDDMDAIFLNASKKFSELFERLVSTIKDVNKRTT